MHNVFAGPGAAWPTDSVPIDKMEFSCRGLVTPTKGIGDRVKFGADFVRNFNTREGVVREEKLILGLKLATAILVLVILMVGIILSLHNCKRNVISATGGQKDAGSEGVNIQPPALNIV
nr:hypothetical protein CFP56_62594 [Quercus suber]